VTEDLRTLAEPTFADLTTLRVGGDMDTLVRTSTEAELIDAVRAADDAGEPVLILGGGSNLLVADEGFAGVVIQDQRSGLRVESADSCGGANLTAPAGHSMDALVAEAVEREWVGIESLSGIPGTVGAAPVQNIGAYGQELSGSVANVRVWDRGQSRVRTLSLVDLDFGYRTSMLKRSTQVPHSRGGEPGDVDPRAPWYPSPRYVVLDVSFQLRLGSLSAPVVYPELARRLGVDEGARAGTAEVREAVLALRGGKGMLLDSGDGAPDHDRWSAGSFFTNPIIPADLVADLPEGIPVFPVRTATPMTTTGPALGTVDPSVVKVSAAWLIEQAGFGKGFGVNGPDSAATVSTKHTLALTNRGHATADDVVRLAREVRAGVDAAFGIELVPEPVLVGVAL
jgi:UDP-N-acetylmuramate dehydrogenase